MSTTMMIQGFTDAAEEAGTQVGGGQTVYNMWPMMGGAAIAVVKDNEFVMPNHAVAGDKIILTKPLGTRFAINAMQWIKTSPEKKSKIITEVSESDLVDAFYKAEMNMATLSYVPAALLRKYNAHACTDVTGFGILGHANYLAQAQKNNVKFVIEKLPIYKNLIKIEKKVQDFKFWQGLAAETSGGLLICLPEDKVKPFMADMTAHGLDTWEIGYVTEGNKSAELSKPELIEV